MLPIFTGLLGVVGQCSQDSAQHPGAQQVSLNGRSCSPRHQKEDGGRQGCLFGSGICQSQPALGVHRWFPEWGMFLRSCPEEGRLLLTYARPLKGASPHVRNALFVKSGEQRWTPSQYCLQQPVPFFSPTLKTFVVSQWQGIGCQPSCSPLGRRAELPTPTLSHCWRPPSETCWQAATVQAGESRAWLPSPHLWNRSLQNTRHLTVGLSPGADAVFTTVRPPTLSRKSCRWLLGRPVQWKSH